MSRTKGSKNKPKTVTADFATQIAEKQSAISRYSPMLIWMTLHHSFIPVPVWHLKTRKKISVLDFGTGLLV